MHHNRFNGDFFGGIYATRLANFLGVTIREEDIELPPIYLDYEAMVCHQFVERNDQFLQYRLTDYAPITSLSLLLLSLTFRKKGDTL